MRRHGSGFVLSVLATLALAGAVACQAVAPPATPGTAGTPAGSTAQVPKAVSTPVAQTTNVDPDATVRFALPVLHQSMDPHTTASANTAVAIRAVFDTLVMTDVGGKRAPGLALEWTSINPTTWRYKLRQGVTFHNGEPFNAATVKWNFDRLTAPQNQGLPMASRTTALAETRIVDDYTIDFITKDPFPTWPEFARLVPIIPGRYFDQVGAERFSQAPVGTGIFRFVSMTPNQQFIGERNDTFWREKAPFRRLQLDVLPEEVVRVASLRTGEIDVADTIPTNEKRSLEQQGFGIIALLTGVQNGVFYDTMMESPIQNRDIRLALNYGTNKDDILTNLLSGVGLATGQIGHPDVPGWNPNIRPFPYDVARARQLMASGGHPNGFTIKMHSSTTSGGWVSRDVAVYLQQAWMRDLGVRLEIDFVESAVMSQMFSAGGYHPLRLTSIGFGENLPFIMNYFVWEGGSGPAYRRYRNDEFSALYRQAAVEFDPNRAAQMYQRLAQILHDDGAMMYLGLGETVYGFNKRTSGFWVRPGSWFEYSRLTKQRS
jgi:peptide/nickel transport system substrate-binding protein